MVSSDDILNAAILVVDDSETNVHLLEGMLRVAGYVLVHSTTDPKAVCGMHRQNGYSLILLDLQMPGMDGFEVMEGLKEMEPEGYLPVVVITAQPGHKLRALGAGARDFVSKPFDLAELRARVHNVLEVRLLHLEAKRYSEALEETVRELEASREVVRRQTLAEREVRERELALAQETQESLLPRRLPEFENFRVRAFNSPTRYVGGDFYDFMPLPTGEWMGVLADVAGKGMPAALLSSMVLGALSLEFRARPEPGEALSRVNQLLCEKSLLSQFVTLFLFVLQPSGDGRFISAGHNPAFVFRAATGRTEALESDACVLGVFETASYEARAFQLGAGDVLVVYSDGVTDAENPLHEAFGERRLLEVIRRAAPRGSEAVRAAFVNAIEEFTEGAPQTDDVTFVVVERYR